jgi:RNA polymerase sigma factor (sigma-70 family)
MSVIRIYKTDEQVLQGLKENDNRAWSVMLNDKDLRKMIFSLVIKNSGNEEDAIDVLQDALIVLYEKVQLGTFELTVKLSTYIYGVSRNIWYNKLRDRGTVLINTKDDYPEIAETDDKLLPNKKELSGALNRLSNALDEISEQCRNLLMAFYGGEKLNTLTEKFGYSSYESIKNNISKCRNKLKGAYNVKK